MQRIPNINFTQTRATSNGDLIEKGKSNIAQATLINDGTKAWNRAPKEVHQSLSYNIAKKISETLSKLYQHKCDIIKFLFAVMLSCLN